MAALERDDNPINNDDNPPGAAVANVNDDNPPGAAVANVPNLLPDYVQREAFATLVRIGIPNPDIRQIGILSTLIEIKEQVKTLPNFMKKRMMKRRSASCKKRHSQKASIARAIELCRNNVFPCNPMTPEKFIDRRKKAQAKVRAVDEFLRRTDNCYVLPDKKHYRKDNAEFIPVVALVDSLRNLHRKFVTETALTMAFSTFCKAREWRTIKTSVFLKRSVCLCMSHANMSMMLEVVPGLPNSTRELILLTEDEVNTGLNSIGDEQIVRFKRWTKERRLYGEGDDERWVYHTELEKRRVTGQSFKELLQQDLPEFREHCRRVSEQYAAVELLKSTLPKDHAICQMDYAENWATSFLHEIAAVFFGKTQVTLHPMVIYTKLGETLDHKCFVGVSSVTDHSFPTTLAFLIELVKQIKIAVTDLKHLHLVTDSPTSQYRNRFSCDMLVRAAELFSIRITWNWLEAGHGKGPCDGVGGALKGLADRVVKTTGSIQNADEFVEKVRPQTQKVTLMQVSKETVDECTLLVDDWKCRGVVDISKQHQATVVDNQLYLRKTSCYQDCCFAGDDLYPTCPSWIKAKFGPVPPKKGAPAKGKAKSKGRKRPSKTPEPEHTHCDRDSELEDEVTPRSRTKRAPAPPVQADHMDSDPEYHPENEMELEDVVGGNVAGLLEQNFSSDDDVGEAAEAIHRTRRVRARERHSKTKTPSSKAAATSEAATATAEATAESAGNPNDCAAPGMETPKETARSAKAKAKAANQARRRRRGELVNECVEDGATTDEEWPLSYEMPIASSERYGF